MPTLPPPESETHRNRHVAESFGTDPERYDRTRPRYPEALVARIVAAGPGSDVLDVGCGTGIAARQFRAAGCRVLGIDADPRMAEFARRTGFEVEVATFEAWDPAGRTFDTVIAGQTWHWVDPVAGAAKAAGVLRPGGRLALFWNVHQPPAELARAFAAVHHRVLSGPMAEAWARPALDSYSVMFANAGNGIRQAGGFTDPEHWHYEWEKPYTRAEWLDQMPTHGGFTHLPPAQRDELLAGIGAAIDEAGGRFTMNYTTVAVGAVSLG